MDILQTITQEFNLNPTHVKNIVSLIDEGNTIPFIARYRKEMTGSCDDQVLRELFDRLTYLRNLEKRKEEVSNAITEQGKMTDEIRLALANATTMTEVEDMWKPPKVHFYYCNTEARIGTEDFCENFCCKPEKMMV